MIYIFNPHLNAFFNAIAALLAAIASIVLAHSGAMALARLEALLGTFSVVRN